MVVGFCFVLIFFFVPETFWDRTPRPKVYTRSRRFTFASLVGMFDSSHHKNGEKEDSPLDEPQVYDGSSDIHRLAINNSLAAGRPNPARGTIAQRRQQRQAHRVGFADDRTVAESHSAQPGDASSPQFHDAVSQIQSPVDTSDNPAEPQTAPHLAVPGAPTAQEKSSTRPVGAIHSDSWRIEPRGEGPKTPGLHNFNSPYYLSKESPGTDYIRNEHDLEAPTTAHTVPSSLVAEPATAAMIEKSSDSSAPTTLAYTHHLRTQPPKTFSQTLRPWNGRLRHDKWLKVAIRPFILFAYPAILWSTLVYSLSVGWLIVLSETMSVIFRTPAYAYNFSALGTGLVYISPFLGGILGTAVAGRVSDIIVRFLARRNGGIYEPEFRLFMAIPVAITTCIGLMGFGWSAAEHDKWIVPAVFFGVISFGCSLGSTTAITFAVDSYRQYAGEALVTLNFSKSKFSFRRHQRHTLTTAADIFHGLVFSLFFPGWLQADGSRSVFIVIGCIQLACLATTIPMYIYGKRARIWTVRKNMMESF